MQNKKIKYNKTIKAI